MCETFEVVSAALFNAKMCIQTGVACGPREPFVASVRDMYLCAWLAISFCQTIVDYVSPVGVTPTSDHEVVRLYVPVQQSLAVKILNPLYLPLNWDGGTAWSAKTRTVATLSFWLQRDISSSQFGPSKSITRIL